MTPMRSIENLDALQGWVGREFAVTHWMLIDPPRSSLVSGSHAMIDAFYTPSSKAKAALNALLARG